MTALEAIHHGLLIYDKGFYAQAKEKFNQVMEEWKLKRTKIE